MIPFNKPVFLEQSITLMREAAENNSIAGEGNYTKLCVEHLRTMTKCDNILLTTSASTSLEMAARLSNLKPGDEVIMPSFTFPSTANAVILMGATPVFVDIRPDTMNIDENLIEDAITSKTKAICVVHYAGVSCEMDTIMLIARKHNLIVIEDAAQGVMSSYKGKALGTIGDFGCFSFHETKNYTMGEGGALLMRDTSDAERADIIKNKGTNRSRFLRGEVDKYSWVDFGGSYLPSDINAAYLYPQLLLAEIIRDDRMQTYNYYKESLLRLKESGDIELPFVPGTCKHNAHIFYIKLRDLSLRTAFIQFMRKHNVHTVFHYVPLHSSEGGKKYGRFHGNDTYTTVESNRLVRLPLYYGMLPNDRETVVNAILRFFEQ